MNKYDVWTIYNAVKEPLAAGIFQSNSKTKTHFSDLFRSSY